MAVILLRDALPLLGAAVCLLEATLSVHGALRTGPSSGEDVFSERIYGSHDAIPGEAPYAVSLQEELGGKLYHNCGGSLITSTAVLTAAHCYRSFRTYYAVAGAYNLTADESTEQRVMVIEQIPHPEYNDSLGISYYDIGVFRLESPLVMNDFVQTIALPSSESFPEGGSSATLWGWGYTETGIPNDVLRTADVTVLDNDTCMEHLRSLNVSSYLLTDDIFCTGPLDEGISICGGDTGGPLEQDGQLIGVIAFAPITCTNQSSAAVHTRVSAYIDFITESIQDADTEMDYETV